MNSIKFKIEFNLVLTGSSFARGAKIEVYIEEREEDLSTCEATL